jgi:hypothetical protein
MAGVLKRAKDLLGAIASAEVGRSKADEEAKTSAPKRPKRQWHAVSIVPATHSCAAAARLARKRFLSREAPELPLAGCDQELCGCRYGHHDDRRNGPRRVSELGVSVDGFEGFDRRGGPKRGRRKTDKTDR